MPVAHRSRSRTVATLLVVVACVLTVLVGAPAQARPGRATWPWVGGQLLAGGKVDVLLQWDRVARSPRYRISYAPLHGRLTPGEVRYSPHRHTKVVRRDRGHLQSAWLRRLRPGTFYCFQVQGLSRHRGRPAGAPSGLHCKMTTRRTRARPANGTGLVVGTYNTCSSACASTLRTDWETVRGPLVERRIREMRAAGPTSRPVDVLAVQEGNRATSWLTGRLADTFTRGCQTGDGTGKSSEDNQSVFVRSTTWEVVGGTAGGMNFHDIGGDGAHGACWVRIRSRATGRELVVVDLHLYAPSTTAGDRIRRAQTAAVVSAATTALPGTPVVYAGDFNSWRGRRYDKPQTLLAGLGYDDAFDPALAFLSRPSLTSVCGTSTRPATSPTWAGHLDRVFVPPGVHVASWKVDYRLQAGRYVAPLASDHNPVVVQLVLP